MDAGDQIRTATWADENQIAALVGLAFSMDPIVRWLLPDPHDYLESNEKYIRLSCGPAFDNGSAFIIGNMYGAALWLPPGVEVDSGPVAGFVNPKAKPAVLDDFAALVEKSSLEAKRGNISVNRSLALRERSSASTRKGLS